MNIVQIKPQSQEYNAAINLRERVLRLPIGKKITPEDKQEDQNDIHFVITDAGKLAGTVVLSKLDNSTLKMRQLAVEPKYQGRNIGNFLAKHCEDFAKKNGFNKIKVHARVSAVRYYKRLGYVMKNDSQFEKVGLPHYELEKSI